MQLNAFCDIKQVLLLLAVNTMSSEIPFSHDICCEYDDYFTRMLILEFILRYNNYHKNDGINVHEIR